MQDIFSADYFRDLVTLIRNGGDIDAFIARIEGGERADFLENNKVLSDRRALLARNEVAAAKIDASITENKNQQTIIERLINIVKQCQPDRTKYLRYSLGCYQRTGQIEQEDFSALTAAPRGFINKLKHGGQIKEFANRFSNFIKYCDTHGGADVLKYLPITDVDVEMTDLQSALRDALQEKIAAHAKLTREKTDLLNAAAAAQQNIQAIISNYDNPDPVVGDQAARRARRREMIADFIAYHNSRPANLAPDGYIELLDKMPDDELIVCNIGTTNALSKVNVDGKLNNIMWLHGLECGPEAHQWHIRKYTGDNISANTREIFTPLITVRQAKAIIPMLMRDLDAAGIGGGVVVPMLAADLPNPESHHAPTIDQAQLAQFIRNADRGDLPKMYANLGEIAADYSRDKYLFSGCTASDDYFLFSSRPGRNGIIYATPHIEYATMYDGITDVGKGAKGTTATGDKYTSPILGSVDGKDVCVGFINVYAQSPDDKFFTNFGMESARGKAEELAQEVSILESEYFAPLGGHVWKHSGRFGKLVGNGQIPHDMATNGYLNGNDFIERDGKRGYRPIYKAETYVSRGKNPLIAKIMHVSWGDREYYIPVATDFDRQIVDARTADVSKTFAPDVLSRLVAQRHEYESGRAGKRSDIFKKGSGLVQQNLRRNATVLTRSKSNTAE